jgi:hypothetical protein
MKNIFMLLIFTLIILCSNNLKSQVTQEWVARYDINGTLNDGAYSMVLDASHNIYVTGYSGSNYCTIKYNSSGIQQWFALYNASGGEANAICLDLSNNVYVTGFSNSSASGSNYCTAKYNSSGVQQWVIEYNGPGNGADISNSIAVDGYGNVYVGGQSWGGNQNSFDYCTIKYNSSGIQQWVQRYNATRSYEDNINSIAIDGNGNIYVTGDSYGNSNSPDYCTIKYNPSGIQQWIQRYDNEGYTTGDFARDIIIDGSGFVYITGESESINNYDITTIKYSSSGIQQWVARYNGQTNNADGANAIAVDGIGNVYITGESYNGSANSFDYCTVKYNYSGIQQWVQVYNGPGSESDISHSIVVDNENNVYITGESVTIYGSYTHYSTIKYNSSGVQQWLKTYIGPGNNIDIPCAIKLDELGNIYITGVSGGNGTQSDFCTIKYSQQIGIKPISSELPQSFNLFQNYPNPFNPSTKIKFDIAEIINQNSEVRLVIFDILGREIKTLVNESLQPGTYEVEWDASNFSSGIYYYELISGDYREVRKMILIK